ncbi:glutamate ligase [Pelagivirga sediminicola]|uniref:Glutamate ligase n=1 Tax=Pelagivirga sediminicola TaxID=2170575 RepID=A0A2T7G4B7_9RHOB|nr:UDP-N-acetylmuramoyl-tripeptide--D-alanyl-D-alanine ligase [Pelagivirga sediminicola]PVA09248.1 glutamate ligase [Pelagivirga sediminicola]
MKDTPISRILDELVARITPLPEPYPRYVVFLSSTEGNSRAQVRTITAANLIDLREKLTEKESVRFLTARHVRMDWATGVRALSFGAYKEALQKVKRNYSRKGLSLDASFRQAVTEGELNGSALLYKGSRVPHCEINTNNFEVYWKRRFGRTFRIPRDSAEVHLFRSEGLFQDRDSGVLHALMPSGLDGGRRVFDVNQPENIDFLIRESATYLAGQVKEDGMFHYGWHPSFDRPINHYNTLRHASSTYALCEAYGVLHKDDMRATIERSLKQISKRLVKHSIGPAGTAAYLMDAGMEVKLGGNAVAILALCKFYETTGEMPWLDLARRLGNGILSMQREDGGFYHILDAETLTPKEEFRTVYYDGEAAFGLMRLYGATGEECWLDAARRAVDHFISEDYWQYHDHWLAYCVNELSVHVTEERYIRFGIRNIGDYLDFIRNRITTFPTLLELCCATRLLVQRSLGDPALTPVIDTFDLSAFKEAMETRAQYLTNGFFFPEVAMHFRNPARVTGSFFIRHHGFRVRIDDVEHYLSGLIAYRSYLAEREWFSELCEQQRRRLSSDVKHMRWTSTDVADLLEGAKWLRPPPSQVEVSGASIYAPSFRADDIAFIRGSGERFGITPQQLEENAIVPRIAIVGTDSAAPIKADSVLQVPDMRTALLALARDARKSLAGPMIGVTGSAGKTTITGMIAHCFEGTAKVHSTRLSANMVRGIAWNLCCAPTDTEYCVLEMAIGQMEENTRLARPDIALFTNISPAHLIHHKNTATIARKKARIFAGMPENGVAVLNRDMSEFEIIASAAERKGLRIVTYGWSDTADIYPVSVDGSAGTATLEVFGQRHVAPIVGTGNYAVYNTMATVAVLYILNWRIGPTIGRLATYVRPRGRGQVIEVTTPDGLAKVIDHSYNANPASMRAALSEFFATPCKGKRIVVLGDMAELGDDSRSAHSELLKFLGKQPMEFVYLIGSEFAACQSDIQDDARFRFISLENLDEVFRRQITAEDLLLVKGSNSTGLFQYLDRFRSYVGSG